MLCWTETRFRYALSAWVLAFTACAPSGHRVAAPSRMVLISNKENTSFHVRRVGEKKWTDVGCGKIVEIYPPERNFEIRAAPAGYAEKLVTLTEPYRECRFTFQVSDALSPEERDKFKFFAVTPGRYSTVLEKSLAKFAKELAGKRGPACVAGIYEVGTNRQTAYSAHLEAEATNCLAGDKKLRTVARRRLKETILRELKFQASDLADPAKCVRLGRFVGARIVVMGSYQQQDKIIRLLLQARAVKDTEIVAALSVNLPITEWALAQMQRAYPPSEENPTNTQH